MSRVRPRVSFVVAVSLMGCSVPAIRHSAAPPPDRHQVEAAWVTASTGTAIERECTPTGVELCFNARDDNCNGILEEGCGVQTGALQFALAWEQEGADVDLVVMDPTGEKSAVAPPEAGRLLKDRECPGGCYGQNLENVYLVGDGLPPKGRYEVKVRLVALAGGAAPVHVVLGARVGTRSYALTLTLDRIGDEQTLALEL